MGPMFQGLGLYFFLLLMAPLMIGCSQRAVDDVLECSAEYSAIVVSIMVLGSLRSDDAVTRSRHTSAG